MSSFDEDMMHSIERSCKKYYADPGNGGRQTIIDGRKKVAVAGNRGPIARIG
jgi:hypothetical protein